MANASDFFGGIPQGDKSRFGTATTLVNATDTTILTVASGGGVLQAVTFLFSEPDGTAENITVINPKVTIDGASERTLTGTIAYMNYSTDVGNGFYTYQWIYQIPFKTSLTVKLNAAGISHYPVTARAEYTIK